MAIPLELNFKNFERSEFIEKKVKERCERLESMCDEITHCHVVLTAVHRHQNRGMHYEVHVELRVPGSGFAVTKDSGTSEAQEDFYVALRDAFDVLERHITQWKEKRRHDAKAHSRPSVPEVPDEL